MRPIAVTMVGFGTFADPVTVDFEGLDVFALVGPTGSGKSTVIDAICFALYGSVPRYDDRRAVGPIVHSQAAEAKVSLTFEIHGRRYVAARVVRRDAKGKASTKEARLETVDGEVLAGTAREMESEVPARLGLDFDQFTRAVVLPQGEFARFLHDKPAARQDLLVQLLGLDVYERMMQRAKRIANETEAAIAADRSRIEALAGATPEARADLTSRHDACTAARARWRARQPELERLLDAARAADAAADEAGNPRRTLAAVVPPADLDALATALREAETALANAAGELDRSTAALAVAETARAAAGARDELVAARNAHARRAELDGERRALHERREALAPRIAAAEATARAAEERVETLRTANATVVVREHLHAGEPCPVCEQVVVHVPEVGEIEDLRAARETERETAIAAEAVGRERTELEARVADRAEMLRRIDETLATARAPDAVAAALDRLDAADAAVAAGRAASSRRAAPSLRPPRRARPRTRAASRRASSSGPGAIGSAPRVSPRRRRATTSRPTGPRCSTGAPPSSPGTSRRPRRLRAGPRPAGGAARRAGRGGGGRRRARAHGGGRRRARRPSRGRCGRGDASLADRVERLDADTKERVALLEASATRAEEASVAAELARLLDASHFERWLVSEAVERLIAGGSIRLSELSSGRYSFAMDPTGRDLLVVDHTQGDERRSVRTLSGGETFQASLALALALSDQLAELAADGAARLESIFLDEGFGTLDAETLETVATTIENLAAGDRMVGIVTHVPELAARIPVQFRVAAPRAVLDSGTGAVVSSP